MLSKRGTVICLGIISYFFCGCGIDNIPNVSISDLDSAINEISFVENDNEIVEKFNKLNGLTFRKNIENLKSDIPEKYNYRNISKKDLNKIIGEMKFIDEMDSYYNAAKSNITEILHQGGYSNVLKKNLNKQSDFSNEDFVKFLSSKITDEDIANLEFNLLTLTIDLVTLVKYDSAYQNNKLEIVNNIITAFYKTYDRIFEKSTGFNFNLQDVAEAEDIKKKIDFNINNETVSINYLNGVNIIAIESYFLQRKATTKDKAASLKKIYGNGGFGRDDANKALKSNAYNSVLGAFSQKLDEVSEIMRQCLSPVISINKNKIVKDLENNDNLTVLEVKNFLENQNKFFHFDKIAKANGRRYNLNNQSYSDFFTKAGQGKIDVLIKDQSSFNENNECFDAIFSKLGDKMSLSKVFQNIVKKYNTVISKSQKTKKDSSFGTEVNFDVSTIDLDVIKK